MIRRAMEGESINYYDYTILHTLDIVNTFIFDSREGRWHAFIDENNFLHNYLNEPAYIVDGAPFFFKHGKSHRTNGPAIPANAVNPSPQYYIEGIKCLREDYYNAIDNVSAENIKEVLEIGELF